MAGLKFRVSGMEGGSVTRYCYEILMAPQNALTGGFVSI
jgi:hypothetical protein